MMLGGEIEIFKRSRYHQMKRDGKSNEEIAHALGVCEKTIYNWLNRGVL
jgi:transposase